MVPRRSNRSQPRTEPLQGVGQVLRIELHRGGHEVLTCREEPVVAALYPAACQALAQRGHRIERRVLALLVPGAQKVRVQLVSSAEVSAGPKPSKSMSRVGR